MEVKTSYFKGDNMDLPRNLYKSPGSIIFNATKSYDTIVVSNKKEFDAGIEAGYIDSFSDALNDEITGEFEVIEAIKKEVVKKAEIKKVVKKEVVKKEIDSFDDDF